MKKTKLRIFVFLMILCLPIIPWSLTVTPQSLEPTTINPVIGPSPVLPSPEPPHRLVPLSILVYTEYVDDSPGEEY